MERSFKLVPWIILFAILGIMALHSFGYHIASWFIYIAAFLAR